MKKAHLDYLKRAVNIAINLKSIADVRYHIAQMRCFRPPIYGLIKDIVGDPRFYSVTEDTLFWHRYALASVNDFIESISQEEWNDSSMLVERKEYFLSEWFIRHALPMSRAEEEQIERELQAKVRNRPEPTSSGIDEVKWTLKEDYSNRNITDCSDSGGYNGSLYNLPAELRVFASKAETEKSSDESAVGWNNASGMKGESHRAEATFMNSIDPTLKRLAKMIGRSGNMTSTEVTGKFQHARQSDIAGVTLGNDLSSLLPSEVALLGDKVTEDIFYRRYSQKRLQILSSSSFSTAQSNQKKGAIFMCIDTSGSMEGEAEMMAKKLGLAIAIIAQREHRPVCVINYSDDLSFFILRNFQRQSRAFLRFLGNSYSGGNNENMLFDFLFNKLPTIPKYAKFRNQFKNADLLVVSDFIWTNLNDRIMKTISKAHSNGLKIYTLRVMAEFEGIKEEEKIEEIELEEYFPDGGKFLKMSDYSFLYSGKEVIEVKS